MADSCDNKTDEIATKIGVLMTKMCKDNDSLPCDIHNVLNHRFTQKPSVNICDYIHTLVRNLHCNAACCVIAFIYMSRLLDRCAHALNSFTANHLFLVCLSLASKFNSKYFFCSNVYFTEPNHITRSMLNGLELELFRALKQDCSVSDTEYSGFYIMLDSWHIPDAEYKMMVPISYQTRITCEADSDSEWAIASIIHAMQVSCDDADKTPFDEHTISGLVTFHSLNIPPVSITNYVRMLMHYTRNDVACCILAWIYMSRLLKYHHHYHVALNSHNCHRLFLISLRIATKYNCDETWDNKFFAKIGGISLSEMNSLEVDFLFGVQMELYVSENDYNDMCASLLSSQISNANSNHCINKTSDTSTNSTKCEYDNCDTHIHDEHMSVTSID